MKPNAPGATVHDVFEHQASLTPDAVALQHRDACMTYGELNRCSNALASRLQDIGVRPRSPVGVLADRSPALIVALLATLKVGGAYVPLSPEDPATRLNHIVKDALARTVLVGPGLGDRLEPAAGLQILPLDLATHELRRQEAPRVSMVSEDPVYVMYTSGSTGTPKGVIVRHGAVVHLAKGAVYVDPGPHQTYLQLAPVSFDASTFEIWGALLNGSRLVLAPPGPLSIGEIADVIARENITTLWLTAGLFATMVDSYVDVLANVPQLLAGGDVVSPSHARRLLAQPGRRRLINGYGPTETTTFACTHTMTSPHEVEDPIPIGRPIPGVNVYILDDNLDLLPDGVEGEIVIGGQGVADGYVGDRALTQARFVRDPVIGHGRAYRTGDRGRRRSNGVIEFLGRSDNQIKVRGYRVELKEIEAALCRCESVKQAVVVAPTSDGIRRLVAYTVLRTGASVGEVVDRLVEMLPPYMQPHIVPIATIPLTASGKVDRRALEDAPVPLVTPASSGSPPSTAMEQRVADVWRDLLGIDALAREDDFFDLGGDSLLVMELATRLTVACGVPIGVRLLFERSTLAAQAAQISDYVDELDYQ